MSGALLRIHRSEPDWKSFSCRDPMFKQTAERVGNKHINKLTNHCRLPRCPCAAGILKQADVMERAGTEGLLSKSMWR